MIRVEDKERQKIIERVYLAGQEHLFRFWDELDEGKREGLLDQFDSIDLSCLDKLVRTQEKVSSHRFKPASFIRIPGTGEELKRQEQAMRVGEEALRRGKVACFLVAGGQSSRLGYESPKGTFPIGPVTGKSLYQLHAQKILALRRRYETRLPFYIMTSSSTDEPTRKFFKQHSFFGLPEEEVRFLVQGMLPSVDFEGKLILKAKDRLAMNPNGHGGTIKALKESGALGQMEEEGIEQIFYFQVDNPLAKIADPVFLGYHLIREADMSCKVVRKREPQEKVGVIGYIDGHLGLIEYSELPHSKAKEKNPDGSLKFEAGNIAIHILSLDFIKRKDYDLPYHPAHKKIPFVDEKGIFRQSEEPNGIKFECFIFDLLIEAEKSIIMEVERKEEFSPLKDRQGPGSPEAVKRNMTNLYGSWLKEVGVEISKGSIEISPLYALDKEELLEKIDKNLRFDGELYLE
ncbi:UDPGP type 1 family protein [bacterium]|nr:UDPGP type 1 family protein [bacterium]